MHKTAMNFGTIQLQLAKHPNFLLKVHASKSLQIFFVKVTRYGHFSFQPIYHSKWKRGMRLSIWLHTFEKVQWRSWCVIHICNWRISSRRVFCISVHLQTFTWASVRLSIVLIRVNMTWKINMYIEHVQVADFMNSERCIVSHLSVFGFWYKGW